MLDSEEEFNENKNFTLLPVVNNGKEDDVINSDLTQCDGEKSISINVNNHGHKHGNNYPDSPISMAGSCDLNEISSRRRKKRKEIGNVQENKRGRRKQKDNIYEVEYILDYVEYEDDAFYLVKWKNWEPKFNTWEPRENFVNCKEKIDEFFRSVYRSSSHSRERIDAYGRSLMKPSKESLEQLMSVFIEDGKVKYEIPSLRKVCMSLNSLLTLPDSHRDIVKLETVKKDLMLRCLHVKRSRQLKLLKEWEDEINASSNIATNIKVENEVDLEGPPENFYYVNDYIPGQGVSIPEEPPIGCNCKTCNATTCSCVKESGCQFAYQPNGTVKVVTSNVPIYECNKQCSCSDKCPNRVVQKGCRVKLSIFRTSNGCGWGVKALQNIPKGTFMCEYVGEVIGSEEAEIRGKKYDAIGQTYLFDLDFNDKDQCPYTVDAAFLGNISHFLNHSCNPNLTVHAVWNNCLDPDLPRLAFFARKPIQANEELTFEYNSRAVMTRVSSSKTPCKCSSSNCRKYLF